MCKLCKGDHCPNHHGAEYTVGFWLLIGAAIYMGQILKKKKTN
jgi:hypothetical protein